MRKAEARLPALAPAAAAPLSAAERREAGICDKRGVSPIRSVDACSDVKGFRHDVCLRYARAGSSQCSKVFPNVVRGARPEKIARLHAVDKLREDDLPDPKVNVGR